MSRSLLHKVLIAGLVIIWSAVGYRFFKPAEEPITEQSEQTPLIAKTESKELPDFEWEPLQRDPFLNTISRTRKAPVKAKPKGRRLSNSKNTSTIWPTIEYFGFVQKKNQSAPLALIKINDNLQRLRAGEAFQSIEIKAVYQDSIKVKFGREVKVIRK